MFPNLLLVPRRVVNHRYLTFPFPRCLECASQIQRIVSHSIRPQTVHQPRAKVNFLPSYTLLARLCTNRRSWATGRPRIVQDGMKKEMGLALSKGFENPLRYVAPYMNRLGRFRHNNPIWFFEYLYLTSGTEYTAIIFCPCI